ncbi:translation initiation factor Sui1 [Raoultella ornithinolytica]|nr:translation initiation factor Sui1 [Raoultella ornithinolytica]
MTDSNSRLVYSTESGRIDEPRAVVERPKAMAWCAFSVRPAAARGRAYV